MKRFLLILLLSFASTVNSADKFILGIHPYRPADQLKSMFYPLADYLSKNLNMDFEIKVGTSYQDHMGALNESRIHLAFMGPAMYVKYVDKHKIPKLAARLEISGKPTFTGKIITIKDNDINDLFDVSGKSFAFGSKNSTMSYSVPKKILENNGIYLDDFKQYRFFGSHDNVAIAVLSGFYDVGAVKEAVYEKYKNQGIGLKIIESTPEISEHLFVTSDAVSIDLHNLIKRLLLDINSDNPELLEIIQSIKKTSTGLVEVSDKDYSELRKLILD